MEIAKNIKPGVCQICKKPSIFVDIDGIFKSLKMKGFPKFNLPNLCSTCMKAYQLGFLKASDCFLPKIRW